MKKIFIVLLSISVFFAEAQYPVNTAAGNPSTLQYQWGSYGGMIGFVFRGTYSDTTAANLSFIKNVPGQIIRIGDSLWIRSNNIQRWWNIGRGGGSQTQQQTFDQGSILTRIDSFNLVHDIGLHIGTKTNGYFEFKDDSTGTNPRSVRMNTNPNLHPLIINANNNVPNIIPVEQFVIHNPVTSGAAAQAMIGFKVHDGVQDTTIGWVGVTSGSYNTGSGGIRANTTYVENDSAGVALLANNGTSGKIEFFVGPFFNDGSIRMRIKPDSIKQFTDVFYQNSGGAGRKVTTLINGAGISHDFAGGNLGVSLSQSVNGSATTSFLPINFSVPTTGLVGQFLATASNYSNAGVNLPANSLGLLATSESLSMIAGNSGKDIRFTVGGYDPASEVMRIKSTGVGIGTTSPSAQALLELVSTNKALLIMRMTSTQASAITAADGMMLYVTDTNGTFTTIGFWGRENGSWVKL